MSSSDGDNNSRPNSPDGDGEVPEAPPVKKITYEPPPMLEGEEIFEERANLYGKSGGINFSKYKDVKYQVNGDNPPKSVSSFDEMKLRDLIKENIKKVGYTTPTPIQQHASPVLLASRDLMACAQTGSGKTAGFLLPIIHNLMANSNDLVQEGRTVTPQCLVLAPTRELALQIRKEALLYASNSVIKVRIAYGGVAVAMQRRSIQSGCNILVATPGRLKQFLEDKFGFLSLEKLKYFILDEADRMLDMGFIDDIKAVLEKVPEDAVKGMFSATFPKDIQELASQFLKNHIFVSIGILGGACADVLQTFIEVDKKGKRDKLLDILKNETEDDDKIVIFLGTKKGADFIAATLSKQNISSTSIHGDREQSQRETAIREFTEGRRKVLVATAVAARGIDIPKVTHVINFDLPNEIEEYVHRIGRTGRVGNVGKAITFFDSENSNDTTLAPRLIEVLKKGFQEIPDCLKPFAEDADEANDDNEFGGTDTRLAKGKSLENNFKSVSIKETAKPAPAAADDDDEWD